MCKMLKFKELIAKYNISILDLEKCSRQKLPNTENFIIKNLGDGMGIVVIDKNSVELTGGSFSNYSFEQLLELQVDTNSWNDNSWDSTHIFTEYEITKILVKNIRCQIINELLSL